MSNLFCTGTRLSILEHFFASKKLIIAQNITNNIKYFTAMVIKIYSNLYKQINNNNFKLKQRKELLTTVKPQ